LVCLLRAFLPCFSSFFLRLLHEGLSFQGSNIVQRAVSESIAISGVVLLAAIIRAVIHGPGRHRAGRLLSSIPMEIIEVRELAAMTETSNTINYRVAVRDDETDILAVLEEVAPEILLKRA
jgi:hypothetical protein